MVVTTTRRGASTTTTSVRRAPPYNVPLSGIEVRIRMMEYSTRQIRQVSVVGDFTD